MSPPGIGPGDLATAGSVLASRPLSTEADDDCAGPATPDMTDGWLATVGYLAAGTLLGIVFMQSEVLSWYRIQEMFRFQSPHMFGIIGMAVVVATLGRWLLGRFGASTRAGHAVSAATPPPRPAVRHAFGGLVFGLGWALLGACPGPIFTLIGAGHSVYLVALVSALAGTWLYARLQHRLPH
jgi:uncharacterized protein